MSALLIPGHPKPRPREVSLEEIRACVGDCQLCPLGQTRTILVFGVGNPHARVMFVGEGPGRNEDLRGEPFVGAAGQKLNGLLAEAGLRREDIYIANVVKCRPPGNRNPKPEEIEACAPFLREQIRSIWPDVIVCLGNFATQFILKTELGVVVDWSLVNKEDYLLAMERSPVRDIEIKYLLKNALTDKVDDRQTFMKGVDHSYEYEGYFAYKAEDLKR